MESFGKNNKVFKNCQENNLYMTSLTRQVSSSYCAETDSKAQSRLEFGYLAQIIIRAL
jgi:hypothetical protein